jgi:hypothetical protein
MDDLKYYVHLSRLDVRLPIAYRQRIRRYCQRLETSEWYLLSALARALDEPVFAEEFAGRVGATMEHFLGPERARVGGSEADKPA